jgi:beta-glucanase (GH16 family)
MASKAQDCDCGFIDSNDPSKSIFSSFLAVDFTSITNEQFDDLFIPASYEIASRNAPFTRNFSTSQVHLSETGLDLTVSPSPDSRKVPCAQIFTRSATFFYGSYHAKFRVTDVPGTVTAFFNYKNDTSEVDIEYLSAWKDPTLLYTVKPQIYLERGNPHNATYQRETWTINQDFHEWSWVWLPDIVHFGLDAKYSTNLTTNVPQAPGRLALSHWSDGNPKYSLGPPSQSATDTISLLWAVYNDTNASTLSCQKAASACTVTDGVFQPPSGGGDDSGTPSIGTIHVNSSAHVISLAAPLWLFVLLFFSLFPS